MEMAQRAIPGIVCGRTMATEPGTFVGLFHDVCGTLNGRRLADGTMLYGALPDPEVHPADSHMPQDLSHSTRCDCTNASDNLLAFQLWKVPIIGIYQT